MCVAHAALAPFPSPYHSWPCGVTVSRYPPGSSLLGFLLGFLFFQAELARIWAPPSPEVHGWGETGEESVLEMAPLGGLQDREGLGHPSKARRPDFHALCPAEGSRSCLTSRPNGDLQGSAWSLSSLHFRAKAEHQQRL